MQGIIEIPSASQPLLVLQGDLDEVVPISQAQEVLAASPVAHKTFIVGPPEDRTSALSPEEIKASIRRVSGEDVRVPA